MNPTSAAQESSPSGRDSFRRHVLVRLFVVVGSLSLVMLVILVLTYRSRIESERSRASLGVNMLLQAALENAMLKRDVPGLRDIVDRLGRVPGIRQVTILNPVGEVRFCSQPAQIGQQRPELLPPAGETAAWSEFAIGTDGADVLRSVNAVANREPCVVCHGPLASHPVNGILVVDYDAEGIRRQAWYGAALFGAAGLVLLALSLGMLWQTLRRRVIEPVADLAAVSGDLEQGHFERRTHIPGNDELAVLGRRFNRMADRLDEQMHQLRQQETFLQSLLDGLPDAVRVIRCRDMRIILANAAYRQQLGLATDNVCGQACHASSHGREEPCVPTLVRCPVRELHSTGATLKCTHRHRRADGCGFQVEVHAERIDIDYEGQIEPLIIESIRDLSDAAQVSHEQRLSELGLLAAGVAHEIHNPLASIRMGVQGLARDIENGRCTFSDVGGYLTLIDGEIDKCIAVTRRLLLLSRTPENRLQVVDISLALDDTIRLLEYDARSKGIEQKIEAPVNPVRVLGDDSELRMVFLNLLQNGHHAMTPGGRLTARISETPGWACVEIIDQGHGIEAENLPHIFEPFFSRRADGLAGTGLGLTIVKNIVERHQGRIDVASAIGQGTTFSVWLPLAEASLQAVQ
ncbi:MAG: ATP-binding protein [Candidatus Accumulibacter sp.]|nr:ATP-binding protein [Accumulibacter sp.]